MNDAVVTTIYRRGIFRTKWDWRARSANGKVVATSGNQGYENRADCIGMAMKFAPHGSRIVDEMWIVIREGRVQ